MHDVTMLFCGAGYGPEEETCVFELTYNYGQDKYDNFKGDGYAQVAMSSEVMLACMCTCLSYVSCCPYRSLSPSI